jgi:hypothetical protein
MSAVACFADRWAWFAAPGDGHADLQIVVAGDRLPARPGLAGFYADRVAEVPEAAAWLDGGQPKGPVIARNANVVLSRDLVEKDALRVGDAALGLDPLSGHGQFQAAASALAGVAVINTLFDRPADRDLAEQFHVERVEQAFLAQSRVGRDFYRLEKRWPGRPFWSARAAWPDDQAAHPSPLESPTEVVRRPTIEEGYVVARDVVVTSDHPRGVWQIDGVAVVPLMRFLDREWRPGAALADAAAGHIGCRVEQVETALAWLDQRGLLTARDGVRE